MRLKLNRYCKMFNLNVRKRREELNEWLNKRSYYNQQWMRMNEWINESGNSDWAGATASARKTNENWVESKLFHVIFNEISTKMLQTLPERGERERESEEGVASWASKKQKLQLKLPSEGQHTHTHPHRGRECRPKVGAAWQYCRRGKAQGADRARSPN